MSRLTKEQAAKADRFGIECPSVMTTETERILSGRILDLKDELAARWQPIETAPTDTPVAVRAGGMTFDAKLTLLDMGDEDQAYGWIAVHEGIHPPCWTDGRCWDVNEDDEPSAQPSRWMPLPEPPQ